MSVSGLFVENGGWACFAMIDKPARFDLEPNHANSSKLSRITAEQRKPTSLPITRQNAADLGYRRLLVAKLTQN